MRLLLERTRWSWLRATSCALAVLFLGEASAAHGAPREERGARAAEIRALERAHVRLATLIDADMRTPALATAISMRDGMRDISQVLSPVMEGLREDAGPSSSELERSLASALAQLDDGGAALTADRSEFVLSALVPVASALDETRSALDPTCSPGRR